MVSNNGFQEPPKKRSEHFQELDETLMNCREGMNDFLNNLPDGWHGIVFLAKSEKNLTKMINAQTCSIGDTMKMLVGYMVSVTEHTDATIDQLVEAIRKYSEHNCGFEEH